MRLKGIALVPTKDIEERSLRDLILQIVKLKPETLFFVSPTGHVFVDAISVDYVSKVEVGDEEYKCDFGILDDLNKIFIHEKLPSVFVNPEKQEEYGITAEFEDYTKNFLSYVNRVMDSYKTVFLTSAPIVKSELLECGRSIREAIETSGHDTVLVVFSDFFENETLCSLLEESIATNNFLPTLEFNPPRVLENSYNSLLIGVGATEQLLVNSDSFGKEGVKANLLTFKVNEISEENKNKAETFITDSIIEVWNNKVKEDRKALREAESEIIKMIRATVELWVKEGKRLDFDSYAQALIKDKEVLERLKNQRTGVFVTITKDRKPRGTMGTINPITDNIALEMINNAIEAAAFDPQFVPVNIEELDDLEYEVSVMDPPELIDSNDDLDPKKYGIIVEQGLKRGVVLPGIEEIQTVEEQIEIAKDRAGINEIIDSWEPLIISRFTVDTF